MPTFSASVPTLCASYVAYLFFRKHVKELLRFIDLNLCGIEIAAVARDDGIGTLADGRIILHGILEVRETGGNGLVDDEGINWRDIAHSDKLGEHGNYLCIGLLVMSIHDVACCGK